jgi:signal transduction histidine kinase
LKALPGYRPAGRPWDRAVFDRARLQLTAWYALTLAVIVLAFSGVLYGVFAARLGGYQHERESDAERRVEHDTTSFAVGELRIYLVLGNTVLLALGVGGAYWLAGRTLTPIAQAMARQERFTADASHELRTPLTAIRSAVDVALQRARAPEAYRTVLQEVSDEAERISALIERLFWLARGGASVSFEPVDVAAILTDAIRTTAGLAAERGSTVSLEPVPSLTVTADAAGLRLALVNLVSNALQHTPSGTMVRLCAAPEDAGVAFRVCDNGPGIPETERANVFQPFYRLNSSGSEAQGLGLALTQELVASMSGRVRIDETPGGGATLFVWLPLGGR